jgi:hypothetical protein
MRRIEWEVRKQKVAKKDRPKEWVFNVRCCRQDHQIFVTARGQVVFLSHPGLTPKGMLTERALKEVKVHGCYYFANLIANGVGPSYKWGRKSHGTRQRHEYQALAESLGLPPTVDAFFIEIGERRTGRIHSRSYRDEIPKGSFISNIEQRAHTLIATISARVQKKQEAALKTVEKMGIQQLRWNEQG